MSSSPASKASKGKSDKTKNEPVKSLEFSSTIELKTMKVLLRPSKRKTVKKIKVVLEGNLVINNAKDFLEKIARVFQDYDYVDFHLSSPEAIDLSFIQSLYHLKTYYANQNKNVTIDSELTGEAKKMIVNSGFENLMFIPKLV